jgi:hypothetical protein
MTGVEPGSSGGTGRRSRRWAPLAYAHSDTAMIAEQSPSVRHDPLVAYVRRPACAGLSSVAGAGFEQTSATAYCLTEIHTLA